MTLIMRLAFATPANRSFQAPSMNASVPALLAVHVCRWRSSHCPLSYQSLPRVGTIAASVVRSCRVIYPTHSTGRSPAYTPATPARISASVLNAISGVSASCGTSVSLVQLLPRITNVGTSNQWNRIRPADVVTSFFIGSNPRGLPSELNAGAKCVAARRRIDQIVDAAGREAGADEHLRIVPRVFREQQQEIVARHVHSRDATGRVFGGHGVADRHVLQSHEGPIFDPARRILRRLANGVRLAQCRAEEVAPLFRVALGSVDKRRVVECLAAKLTAPQPTGVEVIPHAVVTHTQREARVGVADHHLVAVGRIGRFAVDATRAACLALEHLLAIGPHPDEL